MERDSASEGEGEIVAVGPVSSFISFFSDRIRPTEFRELMPFAPEESKALIGREDDICTRISHWRPRYAVGPENRLPRLADECPSIVHAEQEIARSAVMRQWYYKADFILRRVTYRSEAK